MDYVLQKAGEIKPVRRHKQPLHDFQSPTATFYQIHRPETHILNVLSRLLDSQTTPTRPASET
jgi:hypothetical protein